MRKLNKNHVAIWLFATLAFIFFLCSFNEIAKRYSYPSITQIQAKTPDKSTSNPKKYFLPQTLKINSIGLDTPVISSNKIWEEKAKSVVFFSKTPVPGQQGNSVLYGHNWPHLLGNLKKVKEGDMVEIELTNGKAEKFVVTQKGNITADQTHILNQTNDYRLTIYTCSGLLDTKRFFIVAIKV